MDDVLIVTSHMHGYRAMGHIMSAGELAGAVYISIGCRRVSGTLDELPPHSQHKSCGCFFLIRLEPFRSGLFRD